MEAAYGSIIPFRPVLLCYYDYQLKILECCRCGRMGGYLNLVLCPFRVGIKVMWLTFTQEVLLVSSVE